MFDGFDSDERVKHDQSDHTDDEEQHVRHVDHLCQRGSLEVVVNGAPEAADTGGGRGDGFSAVDDDERDADGAGEDAGDKPEDL